MRSKLLLTLIFLFAMCRSARTESLNVLFIVADDLNTRLGCYGASHMMTPNIDRLAARGIQFNHCYCQYPSCGPSRASFLTGLRPNRTQVLDNRTELRRKLPNVITLPQFFRQKGYRTARIGKIFHQDVPTHIGQNGLDDRPSWDEVKNPKGADTLELSRLTVHTPNLPVPDQMAYYPSSSSDDEQTDGMIATEAIRFLERSDKAPFFLAVGFYRPHIPYIAPQTYFDRYPFSGARLPELPSNYAASVPSAALASTKPWPIFGTTRQQASECVAAYDACISFVDTQIGRVLSCLETEGLSETTIVVVCGDHGYHLGEHGLWRKNSLFEESTRTPVVIYAPKLPSSEHVCNQIVEMIDLYPTLVELAGFRAGVPLDGQSLVPILSDPRLKSDRTAVSQVAFAEVPGWTIRYRHWRYTEWEHGRQGVELYDHQSDPFEMKNLAADPSHQATIATLKKLLESHSGN